MPAHVLPSFPANNPSSQHTSRSQRPIIQPAHLRDYQCYVTNSSCSSTANPLSSVLDSSKLFASYRDFVNSISSVIEPEHFSQAVLLPEWRQAMIAELKALEENGTWSIVSLPPGKTIFGCRWVYKAEFVADGSLERYKVRLVAKGYTTGRYRVF